MKSFSPAAAFFAAWLPLGATAYDIGCIYPPNMPDPIEARFHLHRYSGSDLIAKKVETPVIVHAASFSDICQANCLAYHDENVLDILTRERPMAEVPKEYHNSWSRMMCITQCFEIVLDEAGQTGFFDEFWEKWGVTGIEKRRDEVSFLVSEAQAGRPQPLLDLLEEEDYHPYTVGQVVATELLFYVMEDGWNALGLKQYDTETGGIVDCTANCEHYKDTYGYFPRNIPTGRIENGTEKYVVEGNDKYWQPLVDQDGYGFFSAQKHVVPHIGFHAKPKLYASNDDLPSLPDPEYDFYEEALLVVEQLKNTTMDPIKKQKVKFFDIKLLVINAIDTKVRKQFGGDFTFEDELLFIAGLSAGEHDATIMAWREKVRHDVVRPTTVIKRWGSDKLLTFGGDESLNEPIEPVEIAARDFHAFARVMPHAEFPSGSSCICTAYGELTDAWTKFLFNDTVKDMHVGGEQDGFGCEPGVDPEILVSLGCESDFTVPDMKTLIHECSQSRLWGGFHFRAAVTEGEKMCAGVGDRAFELIKQVKNGSTFGSSFRLGDPRPVCQDPNYSSTNGDGDYSSTNGGSPSAATKTVDFWAMMFSAAATSLFFYFAL